MARTVRIEYAGAVYHLQSKGNRNTNVFENDEDRTAFLGFLEAACHRFGWKIYAYALMDDHFHLLVETPEPNLSDGMKWLMTVYSRQFNCRHGYSGHVFGDRYQSTLVEAANPHYLSTLVDYIHLNPARRGMVRFGNFLSACRWTSLPSWMNPNIRPAWLFPERGLKCHGCDDTEEGRRLYYYRILACYESREMDEMRLRPADHTGRGTVQRGWCYGSKTFRLYILSRIQDFTRGSQAAGSSIPLQETAEQLAENIVKKGGTVLSLTERDLLHTPFSCPEKLALALAIRRRTSVSYAWIAQRLNMGKPRSLGTLLHRAKKLYRDNPEFRKKVDAIVPSYGNNVSSSGSEPF